MLAMSSTPKSSKFLLVADRREPPAKENRAPVRRYRLARVRLDGRPRKPPTRSSELRSA